jgi:selenocysteine lyase/cysteine desulfurase
VPLGAGDRILTGRNEYGSAVLAYLRLAERTGAEVVVVPNDDSGQIDVDALADLIDERTKLIGLTWVPTAGGLVNPAAPLAGSPGPPMCSISLTRLRPSASSQSTSR